MKYLFLIFVLWSFNFYRLSAQVQFAKKGSSDHIYIFDGVTYEQYSLEDYLPIQLKASSTLSHVNNRYQVDNLLDKNLSTAWVEGEPGAGIGSTLYFQFPQGSPPDLIEIVPGYARSKDTWQKNYRVAAIEIRLRSGEETESPKEIIDSFQVAFSTKEEQVEMTAYTIELHPLFLQNMAYIDFEWIEIQIKQVDQSGAIYEDTCISEIRFKNRKKLLDTLSIQAFNELKNKKN